MVFIIPDYHVKFISETIDCNFQNPHVNLKQHKLVNDTNMVADLVFEYGPPLK